MCAPLKTSLHLLVHVLKGGRNGAATAAIKPLALIATVLLAIYLSEVSM